MKKIGLIGGISWYSSMEYYRIINETIGKFSGGLRSANIILDSLDLEEISELQEQGKWREVRRIIGNSAQNLEKAGAEILVICSNTIHNVAESLGKYSKLPLLHIADSTGMAINKFDLSRVGLLGTRFTMEKDFFKNRLTEKYGIQVVIPDEKDREFLHWLIFSKLCMGHQDISDRKKMRHIIKKLVSEGAEGIVLGCTELDVFTKDSKFEMPVFDTLRLHAKAAAALLLTDTTNGKIKQREM